MLRFRGLPFKKASLRMTVLTEIEAGTSRVVLMVAGGLIYVVAKKKHRQTCTREDSSIAINEAHCISHKQVA